MEWNYTINVSYMQGVVKSGSMEGGREREELIF
jgi:hypothetical protein